MVTARQFLASRAGRVVETGLWIAGAVLLCLYVAARAHAVLLSDADTRRFLSARQPAGVAVDQSLWSDGRRAAYAESRKADLGLPEALLRIPELELAVPVWAGIDEVTLNRGIGHVPGTAAPGESGNVALAGHRDGFFRELGELDIGDRIEILTLDEKHVYRVRETMIVEPDEIEVLEATVDDTLTLITCYPFYFVGPAPQRFVIQATRVGELPQQEK